MPVGVVFGLSILVLRGPERGVMLLLSKVDLGGAYSSFWAEMGAPLGSVRGGLRSEVVVGVVPAILGVKGVLLGAFVAELNRGRVCFSEGGMIMPCFVGVFGVRVGAFLSREDNGALCGGFRVGVETLVSFVLLLLVDL